ncbi:MAG: VanZ family protein [Alphaproteobacteria bacterium]
MMSTRTVLVSLARTAFVVAIAFTLYSALSPPSTAPGFFPWDKAQHFTAFYVLAVLGALSFPRTLSLWIGLGLSLFGGAIELVQALPIANRDCDVFDWVADTIGIVCALGPAVLPQVRSWIALPRE